MEKSVSEDQPSQSCLLQREMNSKVWLAVTVVVVLLLWWSTWPIEPLHARRDAILRTLPQAAQEVKDHWQKNGRLPESPGDICGYPAYFCPVPGEKEGAFLIVADVAFLDDAGRAFRYACDENLVIQKQPVQQVRTQRSW